jgi:hypothetical protein
VLTETKKLVVPSALSNVPGNNFSQVSSPYMTSFPVPLALIWASHVSCEAKFELSSPSSRLSTTSRKEGIDPVVMALRRGIVTVGDVACAVKGRAAPSRISLGLSVGTPDRKDGRRLRLCELEAAVFCVYKVTVPASELSA